MNYLHAGNLGLGFSRATLRGISLTARVRYACRGARPRGGFSLLRKYRRVAAEWICTSVCVCANRVVCMFRCSISDANLRAYHAHLCCEEYPSQAAHDAEMHEECHFFKENLGKSTPRPPRRLQEGITAHVFFHAFFDFRSKVVFLVIFMIF